MARTTLTAKTALGGKTNAYTANAADLTMTGADVANMNDVVASGKDLIIAHNTGASPYTVTITSIADPFGRTGDITTYSMDAGEYAIFGPFGSDGWLQADGRLYFQASNVAVKFGIVRLN